MAEAAETGSGGALLIAAPMARYSVVAMNPRRTGKVVGVGLLVAAGGMLAACGAGLIGVWWSSPGGQILSTSGGRITVMIHDPGVKVSGVQPGFTFGEGPRVSATAGTSMAQSLRGGVAWLYTWDSFRFIAPPRGNPTMLTLRAYPLSIALLLAVPGAVMWRLCRRRLRPGDCPACGYDLTGAAAGPCPECGRPTHSALPVSSVLLRGRSAD